MYGTLQTADAFPQPIISDTVAVAIVTGVVSILTAVFTVILTNRHARKESKAVRELNERESQALRAHSETEAEIQRRENRRADVRGLVAEFVEAATSWTDAHLVLVPVMYKATSDKNFWFEFVDTDTGKKLAEDMAKLKRASGELRLVVRDSALLDLLNQTMKKIGDGAAMNSLLEEAKRTAGHLPKDSVMRETSAHFHEVKATISKVEERAAELLRGDL